MGVVGEDGEPRQTGERKQDQVSRSRQVAASEIKPEGLLKEKKMHMHIQDGGQGLRHVFGMGGGTRKGQQGRSQDFLEADPRQGPKSTTYP